MPLHRYPKRDLIVPIRDRRSGKRYFTWRNSGIVAVGLVVLFGAISMRSEFRRTDEKDYGRLYSRELDRTPPVAQRPMEVVREAAPHVVDQTAADPMLVAPMAREQYLYDQSTAAASIEPVTASVAAQPVNLKDSSRVAIVGGPEGVTAVADQGKPRRLLKGGVFKQ